MIRELITKNRTFRRFDQCQAIEAATLRELIDLARLGASAANLQPLKYLIACTPEKNAAIFPHLAWAGYLKAWDGPEEGERPAAYIIILGDTEIAKSWNVDPGIAAQNILLGAAERGLGGCMIGAIQRDALRETLAVPERYKIILAVALGKPAEEVVIETADAGSGIQYWRDEKGVHHVPKRPLDDIILA
jgi:nitroreductase